ncbi:MAG: RES domain-containing protein [Pyrinomonadaceae bacterium MAG19_C2-C3]|nr:RES domain-containing protein [Pyrinomonadaceae bacterium MAG19_C2-C3]
MPTGWRIVNSRYAAQAFTGEGARINGGRWNSQGIKMVYTAESNALAILEILVHINDSRLLSNYLIGAIHFDESQVTAVDIATLPRNWQTSPPPPELQLLGDGWARSGTSIVLRVPSAIVPTESNYLINPDHATYPSLRIEQPRPFYLDRRLIS